VNSAIFTYNADRDAYAVAFAGTLNQVLPQNMAALLIPAGPVHSTSSRARRLRQ
jgi:hypothetical protein